MEDQVRNNLDELQNITDELKILNKKCKELRDRKKELEKDICDYLEEADLPAIKYNNIVVFAEEKSTIRKRKKQKEKEASCFEVLKKAGVRGDLSATYKEILESFKGEKGPIVKLKIKAINKN